MRSLFSNSKDRREAIFSYSLTTDVIAMQVYAWPNASMVPFEAAAGEVNLIVRFSVLPPSNMYLFVSLSFAPRIEKQVRPSSHYQDSATFLTVISLPTSSLGLGSGL